MIRPGRILFALAAAIGLGIAGPSWADLIPLNDPVFGPNSVVLDTDTGLEWLNLQKSMGLSAFQAYQATLPGGEFAGFSFANEAEFGQLTQEAFGRAICCGAPLDPTTTLHFVDLFGPTPPVTTALNGYVELGTGTGPIFPNGFVLTPAFSAGPLFGIYDQDTAPASQVRPTTGSFLVRSVPEPSSLALLGGGLIVLGILSWRRTARSMDL